MRTDPRGSAAGRRQAKLGVFPLLVKLPNERVEKILKKERDAVSMRTGLYGLGGLSVAGGGQ